MFQIDYYDPEGHFHTITAKEAYVRKHKQDKYEELKELIHSLGFKFVDREDSVSAKKKNRKPRREHFSREGTRQEGFYVCSEGQTAEHRNMEQVLSKVDKIPIRFRGGEEVTIYPEKVYVESFAGVVDTDKRPDVFLRFGKASDMKYVEDFGGMVDIELVASHKPEEDKLMELTSLGITVIVVNVSCFKAFFRDQYNEEYEIKKLVDKFNSGEGYIYGQVFKPGSSWV